MEEMRKKNLIFSIVLKSAVVLFVILGLIFAILQSKIDPSQEILYYTIQSNILVGIIFAIFLVFEILSLRKGGADLIPNWLRKAKFVITVAITLTCLVYNFVLFPASLMTDDPTNPVALRSIFTHIVVPILSVTDFFVFDHVMKTSKKTFLLGLITPLYYFPFAMIAANLGANFNGSKFPYFFLDYELNTWFQLGGGKIGVFYWLIIMFVVVMLISLVLAYLLSLRRKRYLKKQENKTL